LLKGDHQTVEKLFKEFERAGDRAYKTKRKIADKVIEELTGHAWIEEKIFYPAARTTVPDTTDHVLESGEEEKEWFPQVRSAVGRNRLRELGEQLSAAKPDAPHDSLRVPSAHE